MSNKSAVVGHKVLVRGGKEAFSTPYGLGISSQHSIAVILITTAPSGHQLFI